MMKKMNTKSMVLAAILTSGISLAITQAAIASPNWHGKSLAPCQVQQLDSVTQKAQQKFLQETVELRKQMMEKRAAMRAIMGAGTPDANQASKIAGELFDLREKLRVKADEYGLAIPGIGSRGTCMSMGGSRGMKYKNY
ncbi:hypothetical protein [Desulfogranum marinum]|uniref:hypothetical protein n=1 Tax=Desulfogranum marinum TaxID=453220 RepID=UPI0019659902|nr:hypothetical protein [Desulfogranum marinum]MBM9511617.1 hypothetical protein [Desulfogranum marinum]